MRQRPVLLGAVAAVLVVLVWFFLLWSPRSAALDDARTDARNAQQREQELRSRLARLQAAQNDEARLRAQVETLRSAVPDATNLAEFILDANDAATRAGIDFLSISPTQPVGGVVPAAGVAAPPAGLTPVPLGLSVTGGYFQVLDFMNRLYALPRLVVVDGLAVTTGLGGRLVVQVTARMFTTAIPPPAPGAVPTTTIAGAATTTTAAR